MKTGFSRIELIREQWKRLGLAEKAIPPWLPPPTALLNFSLRNWSRASLGVLASVTQTYALPLPEILGLFPQGPGGNLTGHCQTRENPADSKGPVFEATMFSSLRCYADSGGRGSLL